MPLLDEKFQDPTAQLSGFFYLKYMNKQKVIVYVDGFNFYYGLKSFVTSHRDTKYSYISPPIETFGDIVQFIRCRKKTFGIQSSF